MKPNFKLALASLSAIFLFTHYSFAGNIENIRNAKAIESILTTHKWTLVEMIQKVNDTATNITLFMMPCEKDNFTTYSSRGTYQIMEGANKCNSTDKDTKGDGTWKYDVSDNSLLDSYEGGRKISKRILAITDDMFKIEFEGEGKKVFTLTYFSEAGKTNEAYSDVTVDNSDPSQSILQLIRTYLVSTNRYVLVPKKDFEKGVQPVVNDRSKDLQTVTLVPFKNSIGLTNTNGVSEQEKANLMEQAKRSKTQYVITGNLINATATKSKERDGYNGLVKFEVNVLDAAGGNSFSKVFTYNDNSKDFLIKMGRILDNVSRFMWVSSFYSPYRYNYWHHYYFYNNAYQRTSDVSTVFSVVNSEARQNNFDSSKALLAVISKSAEDLNDFVGEKTPNKIKINRIDGSGKKAEIFIEGGSNIYLKLNEVLEVVKVKNLTVNGKNIQQTVTLGEIKIKEIIADVISSCTIEKGASAILDAYKENPGEVLVLTTGKIPAK